ncbi:MAG: RHS repeat-associated core domain-containing protein, partial [Armatimonadetes bacterium]|nr:RHS repeat-associated core domain-containing protein [Armatimonadota bacterium]
LSDAGLVLWESYSGGSLSGFGVTNAFDQFLRRTNVATAGVSTGYRYDGASRLSRVLDGANAVGYSYVANSPLLGQIAFTNNGVQRMVTTKTYDYVNRLTAISSVPSGSSVVSSAYAYNSASQRTGVTNADSSFWVYTYDSMGQVTAGRKYFSDGTPVAGQQFDYAFDDIGNRQTTMRDTRQEFYTNNLLNQITGRTVPGYVNVLGTATNTATVTVNNQPTARKADYYRTELGVLNGSAPVWLGVTNIAVLNQGANPDVVASVTGNVFVAKSPEVCGYDADGNMTNDGRWVFTWDAENRLKQVESRSDALSLSRRKVVWEFDGQGRRIRQTTYDGSSGSYVATEDLKFLSDGWAHVAELNATNNALVRSYVWGLDLSGSEAGVGGVGGLLIVNSAANGAQFCAYDGNGNAAALMKASDGTESARYEYGPFGETIRATGAMAKENPFRFSTKRTDNTTDFVLYEYRLYSPGMGRWLSRDPIGEEGGIALYAFAHNAPLLQVDPVGCSTGFDIAAKYAARFTLAFGQPWIGIPLNLKYRYYWFRDDGNVKALTDQERDQFYYRKTANNLSDLWRSVSVTDSEAERVVSFIVEDNRTWTSWVTVQPRGVSAKGSIEARKCSSQSIQVRNKAVEWTWFDEMDANSWRESQLKGNHGPWAWIEGLVNVIGDNTLHANFNFDIAFTDDEKREYTIYSY